MNTDPKWTSLKSGALVQQAAEHLTERIVNGELSPGDYLPPEQELCQMLGIGRSTLREAMGILESKGLLERQRGVGVRIIDGILQAASSTLQLVMKWRRISLSSEDLYDVRRLYEIQAAAWAAERATQEEIAALGAACDKLRAAREDIAAFVEADMEFHLALARATHNSAVLLLMETVIGFLKETAVSTLNACFEAPRRIELRQRVFEVIKERNPAKASKAMAAYLDETEAMARRAKSGVRVAKDAKRKVLKKASK